MKSRTAQSLQKDETGFRSVVGKAVMDARGALVGVGWFSAFINILMLTGPLYMLQVYDRVLISASVPTLVSISVLMVAMFAFMGFLEFCRSRVLLRVADKVERDLGGRTFDAWMHHGLAGKSAVRVAPLNDVATLRQFLSGNAPGTFFDIPWVFVYVAVIFALHWMLGVFAVIGTIIILIVAIYNEVSTRKPQTEAMKFRRAEQSFAQQSHRNTDAITAMGMGANMRQRWQDINRQGATDAQRAGDRSANANSLTKALRMMVQSGILGLGGYLAVKQVVTPGTMIAGSIILGRALAPVQMSIGQWRAFNAAREAYARLNLFYKAVPENQESLSLPAPKGQLDVEHVFAGPPGASQAVLSDLNFSLNPGDGLGVIGPSAAGKSTLARLLVGLWTPQKGAIRLDRASYDQWNRAELGPHIGYVPQEVELFDGTIAENISRFTANATPEDIVAAAEMANVHAMILSFDKGYETRIGEGGAVLSGGQTQRIALARALFGKPKLLVLDEPNSNLDSDGDAALSRAIKLLRQQGSTVIVMAHRPSAISAVDKLLMLKDGRQVAFGPKDEVLKSITKSVPQVGRPQKKGPSKAPQKRIGGSSVSGGPALQLRKPGEPS